ncbi:MAG TPA: C40 family peptidase [Sphingomonas sp.]
MRRDLADIALADRVFAPHYALPVDYGCVAIAVPIRTAPSTDAGAVSELLRGETFAAVDWSGQWAWGYSRHDNYVGYVPIDALGPVVAPTHVVTAPAALRFAAPDIKSPVLERLPMGARLAIDGIEGTFLRAGDGFVHHRHIGAASDIAPDVVAMAERLIGTPYRWGGRSGDGVDCSGLVQLALAFAGIAAPRDSDQQRETLGAAIAEGAPAQRGDLVFLPGHVGLMADATNLVHANAHWMAVTREPLADILARQPEGAGIIARRRL